MRRLPTPASVLPASAAVLLLCAGCRAPELAEIQTAPPAPAPLAAPTLDPRIAAEQALVAFMETAGTDEAPQYRQARADLDGDGTGDLLMLIDDPLWCDADGCPLVVFQGQADGSYTLIGRTDTTHPPIALGKHRNNGWHDLLVGVGGGTIQGGTVALQYDGEGYPGDPTMVALLADDSAPVVETLFE
ncbi:hypothetical protein N799_09500 [Lysobacter arseniciresistens ZS79]|uniref:Lipoprotein n=1 Tax=Lysobacter arseniciresistens ZS79 TaxID=913325 RepID=A0A0A0EV67_9GAMM|nr:hypothetical protein [Lysobacter arseniciresistens]KGM54379.1 hypothetical protein N799_09500 [Lysobacter arseniciresistens ZS79]